VFFVVEEVSLLGIEVGNDERILDTCLYVICSLYKFLKVNYELYAKKSSSKIKFCGVSATSFVFWTEVVHGVPVCRVLLLTAIFLAVLYSVYGTFSSRVQFLCYLAFVLLVVYGRTVCRIQCSSRHVSLPFSANCSRI